MARMKRKRKYRSSAFSKSSWNKRMSCRQNMHKARIKANVKARAKARYGSQEQTQYDFDDIIINAIFLIPCGIIMVGIVSFMGIINFISFIYNL